MRLRFWHRIRAFIGGYFWLPCPICGQMSGGHEWRDRNGFPSSIPDLDQPGVSHGICPSCTRDGYGYVLDPVWARHWREQMEGERLGLLVKRPEDFTRPSQP